MAVDQATVDGNPAEPLEFLPEFLAANSNHVVANASLVVQALNADWMSAAVAAAAAGGMTQQMHGGGGLHAAEEGGGGGGGKAGLWGAAAWTAPPDPAIPLNRIAPIDAVIS